MGLHPQEISWQGQMQKLSPEALACHPLYVPHPHRAGQLRTREHRGREVPVQWVQLIQSGRGALGTRQGHWVRWLALLSHHTAVCGPCGGEAQLEGQK